VTGMATAAMAEATLCRIAVSLELVTKGMLVPLPGTSRRLAGPRGRSRCSDSAIAPEVSGPEPIPAMPLSTRAGRQAVVAAAMPDTTERALHHRVDSPGMICSRPSATGLAREALLPASTRRAAGIGRTRPVLDR
jgi:hypothetical protein